MNDLYFKNKVTGELTPSLQAIHEFYKFHAETENWEDEWEKTDIETGHKIEPSIAQTIQKDCWMETYTK